MLATGASFLSIVGLKTWDEATVQYPTQALLAMAVPCGSTLRILFAPSCGPKGSSKFER
jgi:hypothetical protein